MKSAKKSSSQKGFSPLYIIIGVIVLIVIGFVLFNGQNSKNNPQTTNGQTPQTQQEVANKLFDVAEGQSYIFYYPKGYSKVNDKDYTHFFENSNTKATVPEVIRMSIEESDTLLPPASFKVCNGIGQNRRTSTDQEIKVELVDEEKFSGCKVTIDAPVKGVNDSVVSIEEDVWYKEGTDKSIYRVKAVYYSNASEEQALPLSTSINMFTLK